MKLKLKNISTKSFVLVFSALNAVSGFIVGAIVSIGAIVAPSEQDAGLAVWAILIFPILNGILGLAAGAFLTWLYNLIAKYLGGIELEFEPLSET